LLHMLLAVKGAPRSHLANTTEGLAPMEGDSRCRFRAPFGRRQLVNGRRPIGPSGKFGHEKPLAALKSRRARQELPAWPANVRVIPLPSSPGGLIHTSAACFVHETGGGSREMGRHLCRCELPAGRPPMLRRETGEQVALAATNHARPAGASMRAKRRLCSAGRPARCSGSSRVGAESSLRCKLEASNSAQSAIASSATSRSEQSDPPLLSLWGPAS